MIKKIESNYSPAWEGITEGGEKKRIYAIVGSITDKILLKTNDNFALESFDNLIILATNKI